MTTAILWPTFALVALIFAVWLAKFVQRMAHMRRVPPAQDSLASGAATKAYFEPVEAPANNFTNLFEMPVLFFALVPLLLVFRHADHIQVGLAWLFVVLRVVHSFIHIREGRSLFRFRAYLASCVTLSVMWIGFAIDMATATISLANAG